MSSINLNELAAILCIVITALGIISYLAIRAMVNSKFESIEESAEKLIEADKKFINIKNETEVRFIKLENDVSNAFRYIKNAEADIIESRNEFKTYTSSIKTLTETISSFERNSKEQHSEMKNFVDENNKVMSAMLHFLENNKK